MRSRTRKKVNGEESMREGKYKRGKKEWRREREGEEHEIESG